MDVAYVQFAPRYLDVERNLDHAGTMLEKAEADLIVLPELFTSGYFFRSPEDLASVAEPIDGGYTTERMREWAAMTSATLVAGLPERDGDAIYNSAVVVSPDGVEGVYRKVHLYYEENTLFTPGNQGFTVFECTTKEGEAYNLGVMICFDWYYPEAARTLALKGADVIAHPANLVRPDCPRSMPIRALENHVYTITANRYGEESNGREVLRFIGQSEICSPDGEIMLRAERTGDHIGVVSIDPASARDRQLTTHNHLFNDRRPEAYAL